MSRTMTESEKERVIALTMKMLTALMTLQRIAGVTDKEMLEVAINHGADWDGMEANYQRFVETYGALKPPKTAEDWEKLIRRMLELHK